MKLKLSFLMAFSLMLSIAQATVHNVTVASNSFTPSTLTITQGDTVEWTNVSGSHNVNGNIATFPSNPVSFGNSVGIGWTYQFEFLVPGTYSYQCDPHSGVMQGTITVNPAPVPAVPCAKPFISEYIEGSSNNKGFEIYNPTSGSLDLSPYKVFLASNGSPTATASYNLMGSIASGDVFVITTNQADPLMLAEADAALSFPSVAHYNGDDALFLVDTMNNDTLDIIGVIGVDPGSNWPVGTGATSEYTLVRKSTVDMGQTDWSIGATEWDVYPQNTYTYLGSHTSGCVAPPPAPCSKPFISEYIEGSSNNKGFEIYNPTSGSLNLGPYKMYMASNGSATANASFNLMGSLASGEVYVITTNQADPLMLAEADTALSFPSVAHYNGDDALFLVDTMNNDTLDIIGVIGVDPGTNWTVGSGATSEYTLVRKSTVDMGQTDWSIGATEWDVYPQNTFTYLGSHTAACTAPSSPTVNFDMAAHSALESVGTYTVNLIINPTASTTESVDLEFALGAGLQIPADGTMSPMPSLSTGLLTLSVPANEDTISFDLQIVDDAIIEGNETLFFKINAVTAGLQMGSMDSSYFVIIDNDAPTPVIPTYDIADVTTVDANFEPDSLGVETFLHGVVFTDDFDGNAGLSFYIYDNTGGINIFNFVDVDGYSVQRGDSIMVRGEIDFYNGLTELLVDSIHVISTGVSLKNPDVVSVLDESTESEYIRMNRWWFVDTAQWDGSGGSFNIDITNGMDTFVMRIDSDIDLASMPLPTAGLFNVVGVGSQFDGSAPYDEGYQIFPRDARDLMPIPTYDIAEVKGVDANFEPDSLGVECILHGVVYTDDFDDNAGYSFYIYDHTGGINIFNFSDVSGYQVQRGDSIMVMGEIDFFNGLTELFVDSIHLISSGHSLKDPEVVSVLDETTESEYIRMNGWTFVDPTQWTTGSGGGGFNVDITNGTDTFVMRIDAATDLYNMAVPTTGTFNVIGAGSQFDNSAPYDDGYQIFPRDSADIITNISLAEVPRINVSLYPNPAHDVVYIQSEDNNPKNIQVFNMTGQIVRSLQSAETKVALNLKGLPAGSYMVAIEIDGHMASYKVILK